MPKVRFRRAACTAVVLLLAVPSVASATANPTVRVRVEGATHTLLDRTITLNGSPSPAPGACPANSPAAALEQATDGNWDRKIFTETILGETHDFSANDYWAEWINNGYGSGVCNDTLQDGDTLLMIDDVTAPPTYASTALPMTLSGVPATVAPGVPFTVTVTEYGPDASFTPGSSVAAPAAGVLVAGALTGADGKATVTLADPGPATLRGSRTTTRTAPVATCVTTGADGHCGTVVPPPPCVSNGHDGLCGNPDTEAATARIQGVGEQQAFAKGKAPQTLRGTATATGAGIKLVEARLTRRAAGRCESWNAARERFTRAACGAANGAWFTVGTGADWSYLLPARLGPGRYVLDTRATDTAGNVDAALARGRNRIVFFVR